MRLARLVAVLGVAFAFLSTIVAVPWSPHAEGAADGPMILVDGYVVNPAGFAAFGAVPVADYGNGYVLLRIPKAIAGIAAKTAGVDMLADRTRIDVYYSDIGFDAAAAEPAFAGGLAAASTDTYLLQFVGPIRSEWVVDLEARGITFDQYLASYAFVVKGSPAAIAAAASPVVGWVGPYRAGYKVGADLLARTGEVPVFVVGFGGESLAGLVERVSAIGPVEQAWDDPPTVVATVPADRLVTLAQLPEVLAIQEYEVAMPLDRIAGQIHKYHAPWDTRRSGLPSTITGRSPGPDGILYNADDFFEGAGILDTGFDEGDANDGTPDFFGDDSTPPLNDRVTRMVRHTGPTLDGRCGSAHGSHVAGIIAGDGYSWERYLFENLGDTTVSVTDKEWHKSEAGVAPEAKISLDGTQNGNDFFCGAGLAVNLAYWDCQYINGYITVPVTVAQSTCGTPWVDGANVATHNAAINTSSRAWFAVHSNSWGSGSGGYNPTANAADTRMNNAPDRIVVHAAGNDGPDLSSISGEALLKNGLSIGASQNFRPEQFESDNPNLIAGFSSRGGPLRSAGRIKPDLVAIGTSVVSLFARGETLSTGFTPGADLIGPVDKYCSVARSYCGAGDTIADYRYLQGTSMATPHAAGAALLVREYLREVAAGNSPSSPYFNPPSYLVKAILINGAVRMDPNLYEYPGYDQGWGRIDLEQSLFPPVPRTNQFAISEFTTTGTWNPPGMNLNLASSDTPLKVTLVWLDASGDGLSRNLDLRVRSPGGLEYHGNQYTNGWTDPVRTTYDNLNTVEQVEVQAPETGVWTVEVRGVTIPSTAKFALVFSADVGPAAAYKVDLSTTAPTAVTLTPGGSATIPLTVLNFGTGTDTVQLSSNAPAGITATYYPTNAPTLGATEFQDVLAVVTASAGASIGIYEFDLRAVSGTDPSPTPASDFIAVRVEVLNSPLPFPLQVTNGTVDELDPSVLVFDDATAGKHIFIAYRKTSKVSADGRTGGVNVWVAHATLDGAGFPGPFAHAIVSNLNEDPNDLRLLRFHAGNLRNRVAITWTGSDPDETNPDAVSWSRVAYLDAPYTGSWTVVRIQKNEGTLNPCNIARVSFPLFRAAPGVSPNGELIYVWETLAYGGGCSGNPTAVVSTAKTSTDGGATWSAATQLFPPPGNSNFYFFPNGVVDRNDVAWFFVYWRTPTGNDRDLTVRLKDDTGWSTFPRNDYTILDTTDNVQWPAALSTNEGTGNRVYVTFTRDNLQADLKMYLMYTEGTYSRTVIPVDYRDTIRPGVACGPGCTVSADFAAPVGSGLRGPYGTSVSNANYNRRPILNIARTGDGIVWLPHMENANPYQTPNLYSYYSSDGYASNQLTILTSDAFAKGHQMSDTLSSGTAHRIYEVYHSSRGTVSQVNYEVYLLIYTAGWQGAADTAGPVVASVGGTPNPVNRTATFRLTANLNDITTGNSDIAAAEYSLDAPAPAGSGIAMAALDGFDSPTESVFADVNVGALGWADAECHLIFVRGQDAIGNWGSPASIEECAESGNVDRVPPAAPVLSRTELAPANADVTLTWNQAADELASGGTTKYRVFRQTGLGGTEAQVVEIAAAGTATYSWTNTGAGDGDPNLYLYRVRSVDDAGNEAASVARGAKFTRPVSFGWNLVSAPVLQADSSLAATLRTITYNRARTFLAADLADPWKEYVSVKPYNDFRSVDATYAVWVNVLAADTFTVAGLVPSGTPIALQAGWNFVGFPSLRSTPYTVADLKAAVPQVIAIEGFEPLAPYYLRRMVDTDLLEPGKGYWVYANAPATWVVP